MNSIVIVAGGKGLRMGKDIPKQFLLLEGLPILMHTIQAFYNWDVNCEIVLVLPASQHDYWNGLVTQYNFKTSIIITTGGETRFHSVKNGLLKTTGEVIGIHDGVRPLVSVNTIDNCFNEAKKNGNGIPCIPVDDSLRVTSENGGNKMTDRSQYFRIQTPQVFKRSIILAGFEQEYADYFTDDASVIEKAGESINLVEGNEENIKITRPTDLKIAEILIKDL
ncbi:MAG: 2-C-methyl-D-erythritol 4-phosphate cytidylyltransferase [Flavobacteriales bacterium]|jgi:2-C-methyl-D-erythritol 4-phosphate cytidylyltransferase|tara:strand:+ start:4722 stop:5387 length:666 start_codon:yes stop_codon:yes gene_type:complete